PRCQCEGCDLQAVVTDLLHSAADPAELPVLEELVADAQLDHFEDPGRELRVGGNGGLEILLWARLSFFDHRSPARPERSRGRGNLPDYPRLSSFCLQPPTAHRLRPTRPRGGRRPEPYCAAAWRRSTAQRRRVRE